MAGRTLRILSDLHYGDRASTVKSLAMLDPLAEGVDEFILNGDSLDTRLSADPAGTARDRAAVLGYLGKVGPKVTILTGNHDPDLSETHSLDLCGGRVFLTHGDILFDDIVPWGRDRQEIAVLLEAAFAKLPAGRTPTMEERLAVYRRVAAAIPQRHQSERRILQYALRFAADTVWPPGRIFKILKAWRDTPGLGAAFGRRYRPEAKFVIYGHTHRPGVWTAEGSPTVINTGSFTPPLGGYAVDVTEEALLVRRVGAVKGVFRAGEPLVRFSLA